MKLNYKLEPDCVHPSSPEWLQIDDGELQELVLDNVLEYEYDVYAALMKYASKVKHGGKLIIDGVYLLGIARDLAMTKKLDLASVVKLIYNEIISDSETYSRINSADPFVLMKQLESRNFTTIVKRIDQYDYHLEFLRL